MTDQHEYVIKVEDTPSPNRAQLHCWTCGTDDNPRVFRAAWLEDAINAHRDQPVTT